MEDTRSLNETAAHGWENRKIFMFDKRKCNKSTGRRLKIEYIQGNEEPDY